MQAFTTARQLCHPESLPNTQRGVTLLVALILLLVMSMIAVTSLNTSTLEEKMAVNTQNQISVFQGAESGIDKVIHDLGVLSRVAGAYSAGAGGEERTAEYSEDVKVTFSDNAKIESTVTITFKRIDASFSDSGRSPSATEVGTSWGEGKGDAVPPVVYFEAKGAANMKSNTEINTAIRQGVKYSLGER